MKTIEEFFKFTDENIWATANHSISFVFRDEISDIPNELNIKVDNSFRYFECKIRTSHNGVDTYKEHFFGIKESNDKIYLKLDNDIVEVIVKENTLIELRGRKTFYLMRNVIMEDYL